MSAFSSWLESHVWLCTYVLAACALVTLILRFFNKKKRSGLNQTIKKSKNSTIIQTGGDVTINPDSHER